MNSKQRHVLILCENRKYEIVLILCKNHDIFLRVVMFWYMWMWRKNYTIFKIIGMKEFGCKKWTGQTMDLAGSVIGVHLICSNYIGMKLIRIWSFYYGFIQSLWYWNKFKTIFELCEYGTNNGTKNTVIYRFSGANCGFEYSEVKKGVNFFFKYWKKKSWFIFTREKTGTHMPVFPLFLLR